jgi:hypothetical protein
MVVGKKSNGFVEGIAEPGDEDVGARGSDSEPFL